MKHIFFIHSHITEFITSSIMEFKEIPKESCIVFLDRNHNLSYDLGTTYSIPFTTSTQNTTDDFSFKLLFYRNRALLAEVDSWIDRITGKEEFFYYIPNTSYKFSQLVSTHPRCRGYYLIEEGIGSYMTYEHNLTTYYPQKNLLYNNLLYLLKRLNFRGRLHDKVSLFNCLHPNYRGAFCYSRECFENFPNQTVLSLQYNSFSRDANETPTHIIVFDFYYENFKLSFDAFIRSHERLLERLMEQGVKKVGYKLHPKQYTHSRSKEALETLFDRYKTRMELVEIGREVSLEKIGINGDKVFYLAFSSVGIYASLFGNKVFSIYSWIEHEDPRTRNVIDGLPLIFSETVEQLE